MSSATESRDVFSRYGLEFIGRWSDTMQCSACGAETPEESLFCAKCGHNLQAGDAAPAAAKAGPSPNMAQRMKNAAAPTADDEDDEEVSLWKGGYSAKAMIGGWFLAGIFSILLLVATVFFPPAWIVLIPLMILAWLYAACVLVYRKLGVDYELTTQRFIHKSGILKRTSDRLEVIDIDDVTYSQGLIQRMVNVGTVRISSSDRTHPELALIGIDDVKNVADTIDDVRRKERRRRGLHIEAV